MPPLLSVVLLATVGIAQQPEPTVSKDAISVHRVERGTMPLREAVTGSIASIAPARAAVALSPAQADARPNTTTIAFVVEPDGTHARRVEVKYGRLSAALIEILGGLAQGDRVIVTDMSKWASYERVLLK